MQLGVRGMLILGAFVVSILKLTLRCRLPIRDKIIVQKLNYNQ